MTKHGADLAFAFDLGLVTLGSDFPGSRHAVIRLDANVVRCGRGADN